MYKNYGLEDDDFEIREDILPLNPNFKEFKEDEPTIVGQKQIENLFNFISEIKLNEQSQKMISPLISLLESCESYEEAYELLTDKNLKGCGYAVTSTEDFEHERLRDVLKGIKGRFLLSYDDSPKIRELYKDFEMVEVERQNGINNRQGTDRTNKIYKELLIANYPIKANVSRG